MRLPYPFRAMCFVLAFHPFAWGTLFDFHKRNLTDFQKSQAETQWWIRLGCFTFSYRRML